MTGFRVTVRFGEPSRYHVQDVDAADLRAAARAAADALPDEVASTADLLEIRTRVDPATRTFAEP